MFDLPRARGGCRDRRAAERTEVTKRVFSAGVATGPREPRPLFFPRDSVSVPRARARAATSDPDAACRAVSRARASPGGSKAERQNTRRGPASCVRRASGPIAARFTPQRPAGPTRLVSQVAVPLGRAAAVRRQLGRRPRQPRQPSGLDERPAKTRAPRRWRSAATPGRWSAPRSNAGPISHHLPIAKMLKGILGPAVFRAPSMGETVPSSMDPTTTPPRSAPTLRASCPR